MKTAKEILDDNIPRELKGRVDEIFYNITVPLKYALIRAMKEYAKQKCKEQRYILAKLKGFGHEMKNAPEPEFE